MGLSEYREQVHQKYTSYILKTARSERQDCRDRLRTHDSVLSLLASCKLSDRLHPAIVQVMDDLREEWQPEEVAAAFDAMEIYAVNLLEYPWKKEFHTILLYSGFYKTRLEPNLEEPHLLLRIIGYEPVADNRLFLVKGVPSQAVLTDAAIDFFLAATECRVISSIVSKLEHSTPVEVYWMRRANIGDEQDCIDTLTLSRRPLPLHSEMPLNVESTDVHKHLVKFNADVEKRSNSPYDNLMPTADDSKPLYGFLAHPSTAQSSNILPLHTEGQQAEAQLPGPFVADISAFRQQPNIMRHMAKSPVSNVGTVFQRRSPEAPPPVYSAAKNMPSAQLQNISYGRCDEVDALAAILKDVDPRVMESAAHRQQIMSQLENYSTSCSGPTNADLPPEFVSRHTHTGAADTSSAERGWQCPKCTYYNENTALNCAMCDNDKV